MSHLVVSNILYYCGDIWCQHPNNICTVSQKGMLQALYILPNIYNLQMK